MGLRDQVKKVWKRRRKKGDLWNWAKKPSRERRRMERWKALAKFANRKKKQNKALAKAAQAQAWAEAQTIYRKKHRYLKKRVEKRQRTGSTEKTGFSNPDRPWNPYHRDIPNWMIPWLDKSRAAGWYGVVNSGVRTPEYSESLCRNMCGAPSCPGRCAGRASNHNMTADQGEPYGALDVSDYYNFGAIQPRIGSPLKNALGAQDPVHFSVSGR